MRRTVGAIGVAAFVACSPFSTDAPATGDDDDDGVPDAGKTKADARADADAGGAVSKAEAYAALVRMDHPAGYWRCSEGTAAAETENQLAADSPAVFSNEAHISAGQGLFAGTSACDFSGVVDQQASAQNVRLFQPAFSLELWFNPRTPPDLTYYRHLFEHSEGTGISSRAYGIFLHVDDHGNGIHSEYYVGGDNGHHLAHAPAPSVGAWHHIVATSDEGLWVDAVRSTATQTAAGFPSVTKAFTFGAKGNGLDPSVDGFIAEVAVYDHKLTDGQIRAHYRAGKP